MIDKTKIAGFQCIPKDLQTISQKIIENDKICKLLYITSKDALLKPSLTTEEKEILLRDEYIQILPKIEVDEENKVQSYIVINFDHFEQSSNPAYLDGVLVIDILSNINIWKIKNQYNEITLRPYEIASELMKIIDEKKFSGIGTMNFLVSDTTVLATDTNYAGLSIKFSFVNSRSSGIYGNKIPRESN